MSEAEEEGAPQTNQVFIGNLSSDTTLDDLTQLFADLNVIPESSSLFEDPRGRSKGCALAVFADEETANAAIETITGSTLHEKELAVRVDRGPRKPKSRERVNMDPSFIYIGNLPLDVKAEDLTNLFSTYGAVVACNVSSKRRSETKVGWASIQFSSESEAVAATGLNNTEFQGNPLTVEALKRTPRAKNPRGPRAKREDAKEEDETPPNVCELYVGNLPWTVEEEDLTALFTTHGEVTTCEIARDKRTKKSRGWGTVEFATAEQAASAMASLDKHPLEDREIEVQVRRGKKRREKKPRAKAADDGENKSGGRRRRRRSDPANGEDAEDGEQQQGEGRRRRPRRKDTGNDGEPRQRKEPEKIVVNNPECHLFVGNLTWDVTGDDLRELFSQHGEVVDAKVTMNRRADRSRGWGTVEMGSESDAQAALGALSEFEYKERALLIRSDNRVSRE